ncbi:transmembrane anterior posterior transformation protein 1 homolog, partial [Oncorhynchus masou masou]|uniref:transmembrane anterior posterior transformation protein 1 homolog n=1 Tax=Oncorhynchus masou masou TaxID=90313 RepID=UPI00318397D5
MADSLAAAQGEENEPEKEGKERRMEGGSERRGSKETSEVTETLGFYDKKKVQKDKKRSLSDLSLARFMGAELTRGYFLEHNEAKYTERRERVYTCLRIPKELEKLMLFGFFLCLDAFLYVFTLLPLRVLLALVHLLTLPCCGLRVLLALVHPTDPTLLWSEFNDITADVYGEYRASLAFDLVSSRQKNAYTDYSDSVSRRMGFIPLPLALLLIRVVTSSVKIQGSLSFMCVLLFYLGMISLKVLNSIILLGTSCVFVKEANMEEKLFQSPPSAASSRSNSRAHRPTQTPPP